MEEGVGNSYAMIEPSWMHGSMRNFMIYIGRITL
jgi:hypothetical protein